MGIRDLKCMRAREGRLLWPGKIRENYGEMRIELGPKDDYNSY